MDPRPQLQAHQTQAVIHGECERLTEPGRSRQHCRAGQTDLPAGRILVRRIVAPPSPEAHAHARDPVRRRRRCTEKAAQWVGTALYGEALSEIVADFWVLVSLTSLRCARSRQAGEQKRDHRRAGRKSLSHPSQRRVSSADGGASLSRRSAGGVTTSSATGDETRFCSSAKAMKRVFGGSDEGAFSRGAGSSEAGYRTGL